MKTIRQAFEDSMEDVGPPFAVAVSGGADSLALLLLAHEFAQKRESYVVALTVDHDLRPASKEEALTVEKWAQKRGIKHVILKWEGVKPQTRCQEKAREARYRLLTGWCQHNNIRTLLLGHHQQDQEETFLLRLSAGSGLDGLKGMKKRIMRGGICCVRPLLEIPKEQIRQLLTDQNHEWIEDPSNLNPRYFRGRLRNFLQKEGLSSLRLTETMKKLHTDADFIQDSLQKIIESVVSLHGEGYVSIEKEAYHQLHPALSCRLLSLVMQWFSKKDYSIGSKKIRGIEAKIKRGSSFTAGGIWWTFSPKKIFLFREPRSLEKEFFVSDLYKICLWDQRFFIDPKLREYVPKESIIKPLGFFPELKRVINSSLPSRAQRTLPALWVKGKVVAVPQLCYDLLMCEEDLGKFIYLKPFFHNFLRFTI